MRMHEVRGQFQGTPDLPGSEIRNQVQESLLILPVEFRRNPWIRTI